MFFDKSVYSGVSCWGQDLTPKHLWFIILEHPFLQKLLPVHMSGYTGLIIKLNLVKCYKKKQQQTAGISGRSEFQVADCFAKYFHESNQFFLVLFFFTNHFHVSEITVWKVI
jgi:hypothetical protein